MPKPGRNKTIDTALEEGAEYLTRCLRPASLRAGAPILDSTINGDMLEVCALLPRQCADLIIADPPYNLTKSYDGTLFSKKKATVPFCPGQISPQSPVLLDLHLPKH